MADAGLYAFEAIDETLLPYIPLAGRRVLDVLGRKLSLDGWLSLPLEARRTVVRAGAQESIDPTVVAVIDGAVPPPARIEPSPEPASTSPPPELVAALGPSRPLDGERWQGLGALGRYALVKCVGRLEKLARAYAEIAAPAHLSHLSHAGEARMVDVGGKSATTRRAVASACVRATPAAIDAIAAGRIGKGDVLAAARVAGILAAKRTPELIPLCHPVQTTRATIDFEADAARGELRIVATVDAIDRTGVEMEALVAASLAALTVYDMIKSADRWASIASVRLEAKSGGKSGELTRPPDRG